MGQNGSGASREPVLAAFGGTVITGQTGAQRPVSGQLHGAAGSPGRRHADRVRREGDGNRACLVSGRRLRVEEEWLLGSGGEGCSCMGPLL